MKPDGFLLACRVGRWRWPWALFGTLLTITLVLAIGLVTGPFETRIAGLYGVKPVEGAELIPGRLDTFLGFFFYAISMWLAPVLVIAGVHGLDPRRALGPGGKFDWMHVLRGALAMLLVLAADAGVSYYRDPQAFTWLNRPPIQYSWLVIALPVILFQSFSEEYLFKGYFVRTWGAVLPVRWPIIVLIGGLFTVGHSINDDVSKDLIFNLLFFFVSEVVTMLIYFRTESLAGVTGMHWANNVFAMLLMATEPGQSRAMSLAVYKDPILSAGKSRLMDPFSWGEVVVMMAVLWVLLTWRYSPLSLPKVAREEAAQAVNVPPPRT